MADGSIDDPTLKEKVDAMTAVPDTKPLLPEASPETSPADTAEPPKKKKGMGAFGILAMAKKKKAAAAAATAAAAAAEPSAAQQGKPRRGSASDVGSLERKMKLEMCLKDLQARDLRGNP